MPGASQQFEVTHLETLWRGLQLQHCQIEREVSLPAPFLKEVVSELSSRYPMHRSVNKSTADLELLLLVIRLQLAFLAFEERS